MRRVDPDGVADAGKPRVGAALGAMAVDHVGADLGGAPCDMRGRPHVAEPDLPAHRDTREAEREVGRQFREHRFGARAAGRRIGDQPDAVSARGLSAREIDHVAEQAADRGAQHVQNLQASGGRSAVMRKLTLC